MALYFTTTESDKSTPLDWQLAGRASYGFKSKASAELCCHQQNARAESLGVKVRYSISVCDDDHIGVKEIRE